MDKLIELFKPFEELDYYDYYHPRVKKSQYIPGLTITQHDKGTLFCPKCNKEHNDIAHSRNITCKCGLYMERWGRLLKIRL
jgi:hypothetical protein